MEPFLPLRPQLARQVRLLSNSTTRLFLMSVRIPNLSRQSTVATVLAVASATDLVGILEDGSIGIFALRAPDRDDEANVDDRFLRRLQAFLRNTFVPDFDTTVKIAFRSVRRWAREIGEADDLVDALFGAPVRTVGIGLIPSNAAWTGAGMARAAAPIRLL